MGRLTHYLRTVARYVTNGLEEVGRQLSFYGRVMVDVATMRIFRRGYGGQLATMISDITIGAGALIVGGGMVFVIFSM
jgi:phospholipid/cholesterol/gamma-HCH transport system permease protein